MAGMVQRQKGEGRRLMLRRIEEDYTRPRRPWILLCPNKAEKYDSLIRGSANLQLDHYIEGRSRLREIPILNGGLRRHTL